MRALCSTFFVLALSAQVSAPVAQPQWLTDLQNIQQEAPQAELGSLDARVEQAWKAALASSQYSQLPQAAQMAWSFYQSQGYDVKAEGVLREALASIPKNNLEVRRNLMSQLAIHFENAQELIQALAVREEMAKTQLPAPANGNDAPPNYDLPALANLYERIGELEKAEAAWKGAAAARAAVRSPGESRLTARVITGPYSYGLTRSVPNELAEFYARTGRIAEAGQLYQKALADAAASSSTEDWTGAASAYIGFLSAHGQTGKAIDLLNQGIARLEASSDPQRTATLFSARQQLANFLQLAGRPAEALTVQKELVVSARALDSDGPGYVQALGSLAQMLIQANRLEDAEKAALQMRDAGGSAPGVRQYHESMAVQTLARIRDLQNRPEEARKLRESDTLARPVATDRPMNVFEAMGPAQQAALNGDTEAAVRLADKALALAAERSLVNPQEIMPLMGLANLLMAKQKETEAQRIAVETLGIVERLPDHPRVADVLGSLASALARLGRMAESQRASARQEKILIAAKGPDSLGLNALCYGRIEQMQRDSDWTGIVDERKRMLARTEKATGPKSRESMFALREVAWAYPALNNWPEEETVLVNLLERTRRVAGQLSIDYAHLLVHMANRASQNRQFDKALAWIDQAIETARTLPEADSQVPSMVQNRAQILLARDTPQEGPFYAPAGAPINRRLGKWFDADATKPGKGSRVGNAQGTGSSTETSAPVRAPKP